MGFEFGERGRPVFEFRTADAQNEEWLGQLGFGKESSVSLFLPTKT